MGISRAFFGSFFAISLVWTALAAAPSLANESEEDESRLPAVIVKVEGDGIAKVKKRYGAEEVAGARGKVYPGDKVITDDKTAVLLMINDGSVIKVGLSSEFTVEEAGLKGPVIAWAFRLVRGTLRALVEKNPESDMRFRLHTPSGTIGVRGTEFVVAVGESEGETMLFTLDGVVAYGGAGCEKHNKCLDVSGGEVSTLRGGAEPTKPRPFEIQELFGVAPPAPEQPLPGVPAARIALFRDVRKVGPRFNVAAEATTLKKIADDAREELAAAQDRAIGRTKEERIAMHKAAKQGTWKETLRAGDAYAKAKGFSAAKKTARMENMVAQMAAAKFRLGSAVMQAREAGLFQNTDAAPAKRGEKVNWAKQEFALKKNLEFDQEAKGKAAAIKLAEAGDDYKGVMKAAGTEKLKEQPEKDCTRNCGSKLVVGFLESLLDKVLTAFTGKSKDSLNLLARADAANGANRLTTMKEKSRVGADCFETTKDCRLVPCSGFKDGRVCKRGESTMECTSQKVKVPCQ